MTSNFKIRNPQSNSVLGMYVDEPIGMDHPLFMIRCQSKIDAQMAYQRGVPLKDATTSILKRIRYLFGEDIPEELVRAAVFLVYTENSALQSS